MNRNQGISAPNFWPPKTIWTNHKKDLKTQLLSYFVIGCNSCRMSKIAVALAFWQTVMKNKHMRKLVDFNF